MIDALESLGGEARISEIRSCIDSHPDTVRKLLRKLVLDGSVRRVKHGVYQLVSNLPRP